MLIEILRISASYSSNSKGIGRFAPLRVVQQAPFPRRISVCSVAIHACVPLSPVNAVHEIISIQTVVSVHPSLFSESLVYRLDRRRLSISFCRILLIVNNDHHPHSDLTIAADQRCAMDPFVAAVLVGFGYPSDIGRDAPTFSKSGSKLFANSIGTANFVQERRLKYARDPLRGRREENSQRWVGPD